MRSLEVFGMAEVLAGWGVRKTQVQKGGGMSDLSLKKLEQLASDLAYAKKELERAERDGRYYQEEIWKLEKEIAERAAG